jgi:hypothetical protein
MLYLQLACHLISCMHVGRFHLSLLGHLSELAAALYEGVAIPALSAILGW